MLIYLLFASLCVNLILIVFAVMLWPYIKAPLQATLGDRNVAIVFERNNTISIKALKHDGNLLTLENPIYKYIKNTQIGAYRWGNLSAEIIYKQTGLVPEAEYAAALDKLEEWGFETYDDLADFLTSVTAAKEAGIDPTDIDVNTIRKYRIGGHWSEKYSTITDILKEHPEVDFKIFYPLVGCISLKPIANYFDTAPEAIGAALEQSRATFAHIYADKTRADKKLPTWLLIVIFVVIIAVGCFLLM